MDGETFDRGTLLVPRRGNPDDLASRLESLATEYGVRIVGTSTAFAERGPDLGGRHFGRLVPPRVALLAGPPVSTSSYGSLWYLLDHELGLRVSSIPATDARRSDLSKYNVIALPSGAGRSLDDLLGPGGRERLEAWVKAGGTLIALGRSTSLLTDPKTGLSSVRRRRDVLDKLSEYEEDLARKEAAANPTIDFEDLWHRGQESAKKDAGNEEKPATDEKSKEKKPAKKESAEERKKQNDWERRFRPGGSIVLADLDREHWITSGFTRVVDTDEDPEGLQGRIERLPESKGALPVLLSGNDPLLARSPVQVPVRLVEESSLRLSGLLWPEARKRFARTAHVTQERVGRGQIILFADDPTFRGMLKGPRRLLLNAFLLGPGLGTSPSTPW